MRTVVLFGFLIGVATAWTFALAAEDKPPVRPVDPGESEKLSDDDVESDEEPTSKDSKASKDSSKSGSRPRKLFGVIPASAQVVEPNPQPVVTPERVIGNGFGTMGRGSYLGGKTFGRNDSMTPLEYMPYFLLDEHFIFADVRGFVTNRSQGGGSMGVGYRYLFDQEIAWAGASAWYDADQSTSKMFQQVGLSFEGLIQQLEVRSNVYLPFTSPQTYANVTGASTIVNNQLMYSRYIDVGYALKGVDAEVGYSWPVLNRHIVRGYVGGYHFEGGPTNGINGFKARIEGVINNTVTAQALYTHDKLYGDHLMVGLSMQFPFGSDHPNTGWFKDTPSPFRFVERNYNVIVDRPQSNYINQVATDPVTNHPYLIDQISAPASGPVASGTPNGSAANPYSSVAAAQAAGGNVFLVQTGSVLTQPITLAPGQRLFGEGNYTVTLPTTGGGTVTIPNFTNTSQSGIPIIQNVAGTAVTIASNTEVAGFNITGASGSGIVGTGAAGVSLHDLTFASIGGDAINLTDPAGTVNIYNTQITSAAGNGIVINGGASKFTYSGAGDTISAQGNGFVLENVTGGTVAIKGLSLQNIGGTGLVISNVATNATIDSLNVSQSGTNGGTGSAVNITGNTGRKTTTNGVTTTAYNTYNFTGNTTINAPSGNGFSVNSTDAIVNVANLNVTSSAAHPAVALASATSKITIDNLTVNTQNATGLSANAVTSLQVNAGSLTTVNAPAMDIESSGLAAKLSSVSVNGGPFGIKLASSTGNLTITGGKQFASGGTIQNTTTAGLLINSFTNTSLTWVDFVNNAAAIQSTGSTSLSLADLRVSGSSGYAIDSLNDLAVNLLASTFGTNGAVGGGTIRLQAGTNATYAWNIQNNTITDQNGSAIQFLAQSGGAGASLTAQITGNTISGYNSGSKIISGNWNGTEVATIGGNTINAYGSNMTAVSLQDTSTTALLTGTIGSNLITFQTAAATSGTGIWVVDGQSGQTSTVASPITLQTNTIKFEGTGGTGLRFGLYDLTDATINGNAITDTAGGATGMLFDYASKNTVTIITSNAITFVANDPMTNHGIVFTQVAPTVNLYTPPGTAASFNNAIYNCTSAKDAFSIPAGTAIGGLVINGVFFAPP